MDNEDRPIKALYEHCVNVYERMAAEAEPAIDVDGHSIYEGHLTSIFQELMLSTPYYTSVLRMLKAMGCIEQIRRGGGNAHSKWRLTGSPTEEVFNLVDGRAAPKQGSQAALAQQVLALSKRVGLIELVLKMREDVSNGPASG